MKRLLSVFRWGYVAPRLALVLAVVGLLSFGLAPLLHWLIVSAGQATTGAAVEIGALRTSVVRTSLELDSVQIANPERPMKNAVEADAVRIDLSAAALLRKKFVVQDGSISGLRFNRPRRHSGELPESQAREEEPDDTEEPGEPLDLAWLASLGDDAQQRLLEEFETARLSAELLDIWPPRYQALEQQAQSLAERAKALQRRIRDFAKNAKKQPGDVIEMEAEIRELHEQTQTLRKKIGKLAAKLDADRQRVNEARLRDAEKLRTIVFEEQLDAETISHYLLRRELAAKIESTIDWIVWCRDHIPRRVPETKPTPGKGIDITFPGLRRVPDYWVQRLHLDGEIEINGRPMAFAGTASNFTSDPVLLGQPAIVHLKTTDAAQIEVVARFDRSGLRDVTTLAFDCPRLVQARRELGRQDQLELIVSPGFARVHAELKLEEDQIEGELAFVQEGIRIEPRVGKKLGGLRVAGYLNDSLQQIERIEGTLRISGTPRLPKLKVESSLGGEIVAALENVGRREISHQRERLESQLAKLAEQRTADLVARVEQRQRQLTDKLGLTDETVAALKRELVQHVGLPNQFLGNKLPLGNLLK
ncbi:MAG: TIGR03545 family protein [Planctomycetales bacterium]|nr:TIGR03545 family protein [Planctomycetales bacterium]